MQFEPAIESRAARRRLGLLVGADCLTYAGVLAAAFIGRGTSLGPSSLLPTGTPSAFPSLSASPTPSASASAGVE
ncbi:hypothetical protein [Streptomyces sp. NPDC005890]|uniref:hypothetical protein n=1 Tax=Streptomyces sp. NPDC005890 TaxID=3154568 RepID=UPI0033F99B5D